MPTEEQEPAPRRSRTAEVIDAAGGAASTVARFSPQQVMHLITVIAMVFVCGMLAFTSYADREDRRAASAERKEAHDAQLREFNAQAELMRQHCSAESRQLRDYFSAQSELQRKFEADQREKDRSQMLTWHATMLSIGSKLIELERFIREGKKPPE